MKVRLFGSSGCVDCMQAFVLLNKLQIAYKYIDGHDEDENVQNFCDEQNVDSFPHLQFLDNFENVIVDHIGPISEEEMTTYLKKYFPNY